MMRRFVMSPFRTWRYACSWYIHLRCKAVCILVAHQLLNLMPSFVYRDFWHLVIMCLHGLSEEKELLMRSNVAHIHLFLLSSYSPALPRCTMKQSEICSSLLSPWLCVKIHRKVLWSINSVLTRYALVGILLHSAGIMCCIIFDELCTSILCSVSC